MSGKFLAARRENRPEKENEGRLGLGASNDEGLLVQHWLRYFLQLVADTGHTGEVMLREEGNNVARDLMRTPRMKGHDGRISIEVEIDAGRCWE